MHFQEQQWEREYFIMKKFEHSQKIKSDWAEHLLRLEVYTHQLAYFQGSPSVDSQSRVQDDSPVTPESPEPTAESQSESQSPASG